MKTLVLALWNDRLHLCATVANCVVLLALVVRRTWNQKYLRVIFAAESVSFFLMVLHNWLIHIQPAWLFHYRLREFDLINWMLMMAVGRSLRCIEKRWLGNLLDASYFLWCIAVIIEYVIADPLLGADSELANRMYFVRQWWDSGNAFLLAFVVYHRLIGNPYQGDLHASGQRTARTAEAGQREDGRTRHQR